MLLRNECICLTLQLNGLGDRGAAPSPMGLRLDRPVTSVVSLDGDYEAGATAIAAVLGPRGARGPALALLKRLSLRGNPVGTPGAAALARHFTSTPRLKYWI